jgi:hypothetical protein
MNTQHDDARFSVFPMVFPDDASYLYILYPSVSFLGLN